MEKLAETLTRSGFGLIPNGADKTVIRVFSTRTYFDISGDLPDVVVNFRKRLGLDDIDF